MIVETLIAFPDCFADIVKVASTFEFTSSWRDTLDMSQKKKVTVFEIRMGLVYADGIITLYKINMTSQGFYLDDEDQETSMYFNGQTQPGLYRDRDVSTTAFSLIV